MKYTFRVELIGYGETEQEAVDNALESFFDEPGELEVIVMEEEE